MGVCPCSVRIHNRATTRRAEKGRSPQLAERRPFAPHPPQHARKDHPSWGSAGWADQVRMAEAPICPSSSVTREGDHEKIAQHRRRCRHRSQRPGPRAACPGVPTTGGTNLRPQYTPAPVSGGACSNPHPPELRRRVWHGDRSPRLLRPQGEKIKLAVSRLRHTTPDSQYQGVILVNPGGPGGSGLIYSVLQQFIPNGAGPPMTGSASTRAASARASPR